MTYIRKLIEDIEDGKWPLAPQPWMSSVIWQHICAAFNGSLDAAKTLESLLPDDFVVMSDSTGFAHVWQDEFEVTHNWTALVPENEGRSRLLAILKAYEAQQ